MQGHSSFTEIAWGHTIIIVASHQGSVKLWANQVTGRDSTRGTSDQPTLPYGHCEGCLAGTRASGHRQGMGHLFSFVSQATTEDHCPHVGSNHYSTTKETSLDRQEGQHRRDRSTIPMWAAAMAALQHHIHPPQNIQQSQAAWRGATRKNASFPKSLSNSIHRAQSVSKMIKERIKKAFNRIYKDLHKEEKFSNKLWQNTARRSTV